MTRLIKFRAWDNKSKQMVLRVERITFDGGVKIEWIGTASGFLAESRDFELMQYTGLKDSKEKEIYEGDIVIFWDDMARNTFDVAWEQETCSYVLLKHGGRLIMDQSHRYEVIGNIYENPELLDTKS
jgi:uncharacterized phage protein (TIGR01671 family)